MSSGTRAAVLGRQAPPWVRPRSAGACDRPLVRLATFAALAFFGLLRWGTLLSPDPGWRLLALLGIALALAAGGPALRTRSRAAAMAGVVAAVLAVLAVAGVPLAWMVHLRVADAAQAVGHGLAALPRVLLPYIGINEWVRIVILLGAGVLLLDAGLLLAFAPKALGDLRRAGAALPLMALAVVPSTLIRPHLPYVQGLVLFGLLAAFTWGERVRGPQVAGAIAVAALAGAGAALASPGLDQRRPWVNYEALAGTLSPGQAETFDWSQSYGPIDWPRLGRDVLEVRAAHPDYWKAEDIERFDGSAWTKGPEELGARVPGPPPDSLRRFTQTIEVTVRALRTTDVIAAGSASAPAHVYQGVVPGLSPGTWTADSELGPGDSYTVSTYSPRPTPAELATAGGGGDYPNQALIGERAISLPPSSQAGGSAGPGGPSSSDGSSSSVVAPLVAFAPFHSRARVQSVIGPSGGDGTKLIESSPYARAFALASRLERWAPTPYAFVLSVEGYLSSSHGFRYDEDPPPSTYPLETFLFKSKLGYCQQFSGAMALLLRMGGIPARVAAGFTTGTYDQASHQWVVSDLDAHSWVEAWFPRYGWVRFDPTPAGAPARGGSLAPAVLRGSAVAIPPAAPARRRDSPVRTAASGRRLAGTGGGAGGSGWVLPVVLGAIIVVLAAAMALALRAIGRRGPASSEELVAELERALARCGEPAGAAMTLAGCGEPAGAAMPLARCGEPAGAAMTLAALECRWRSCPQAAAYVQAIRLQRFGGGGELPTRSQRRALRASLRAGLGVTGGLRALWALPPRGMR